MDSYSLSTRFACLLMDELNQSSNLCILKICTDDDADAGFGHYRGRLTSQDGGEEARAFSWPPLEA
jgi:hypothetical protein